MTKEKSEMLEQRLKEQERLIAEGTIERPKRLIWDFTPEEQKVFDMGISLEEVINELAEKYGKID
jgi:hypothetical protein